MEIRKVQNADGVTIYLEGKFTFSDKDKFQEIAMLCTKEEIVSIMVDCNGLNYMDSSAIGMFLILQENAARCGAHVTVINVGKNIRPLFERSALGRMFDVKYEE